jgi:flagellar hook-length control protein FliK
VSPSAIDFLNLPQMEPPTAPSYSAPAADAGSDAPSFQDHLQRAGRKSTDESRPSDLPEHRAVENESRSESESRSEADGHATPAATTSSETNVQESRAGGGRHEKKKEHRDDDTQSEAAANVAGGAVAADVHQATAETADATQAEAAGDVAKEAVLDSTGMPGSKATAAKASKQGGTPTGKDGKTLPAEGVGVTVKAGEKPQATDEAKATVAVAGHAEGVETVAVDPPATTKDATAVEAAAVADPTKVATTEAPTEATTQTVTGIADIVPVKTKHHAETTGESAHAKSDAQRAETIAATKAEPVVAPTKVPDAVAATTVAATTSPPQVETSTTKKESSGGRSTTKVDAAALEAMTPAPTSTDATTTASTVSQAVATVVAAAGPTDSKTDASTNTADARTAATTDVRGDRAAVAEGPRLPSRLETRTTTHSALGEGTTSLSQADRARLVQRVARAVQTAQERGGELKLRLSPPELGSLKLELKMQDGSLTARIETQTPEAKQILIDNLPALRERLTEQNIRVERFDVDLSNSGSQQGSSQLPDRQFEQAFREQRGPGLPSGQSGRGTTTATETPTAAPATGDGRLNILI